MRRCAAPGGAAIILAGLLAGTAGAAPVLAPAPDLAAVPNGGEGTHFSAPTFGPEGVVCQDVERRLVILNPRIVQGEPVMARLHLAARPTPGRTPTFSAQLVYGGGLTVLVQPPRGIRPYSYRGPARGTAIPAVTMELKNVRSTRLELVLAVDTDSVTGAAFDAVGEYRLRFNLECIQPQRDTFLQDLGTFTITVDQARGDDAKALDWLQEEYNAFMPLHDRIAITAGGREVATPAQVAIYERIIAELPAARLRPHCMIVAADYRAVRQGTGPALELLDQIEREYPNTPFAQEAAVARHRLLLGREGQGSARLRDNFMRLWSDPTTTTLLLPSSETFRNFIGPYSQPVGTQWMIFTEPGPDPIGTGTAEGIRIALSPEVQEQFGLPEFVTPEQLRDTPIRLNQRRPPGESLPTE